MVILYAAWGCGSSPDSQRPAVYVDPSAAAPGNGSRESPYNAWSRVAFAPGTDYLQKRGTVARESVTISVSGAADSPILLGAYGDGAPPVIQGSEAETGWVHVSGQAYKKSISFAGGEGPGMLAQDGMPLAPAEWNTDAATTAGSLAAGSYAFNSATGEVLVRCTDGAAPDAHTIEVSRRYYGIHGSGVSHIRIENLHIRNVSLHGIAFEDGSDITVRGCTVEKSGGAVISVSPFLRAGNGIEFGNASSRCSVSACTVADIFDSGISPQTYDSNKNASGFTIAGCSIARCGFAGIEVAVLSNGGKTGSSISGVNVRDTSISSCGKGWSGQRYGSEGRGIKIAADAGAGGISGVSMSGVTVTGCRGRGFFLPEAEGRFQSPGAVYTATTRTASRLTTLQQRRPFRSCFPLRSCIRTGSAASRFMSRTAADSRSAATRFTTTARMRSR
jgi:hypothetical protein